MKKIKVGKPGLVVARAPKQAPLGGTIVVDPSGRVLTQAEVQVLMSLPALDRFDYKPFHVD